MWHVWGTGDVHTEFWLGDLRGRDHLTDLGLDGRTIIKRIRRRKGQVAGVCECGNEPSGFIQCGEFLG
jgi:hypothetical protein